MKIVSYWKQILAWGLCIIIAISILCVVHEDKKKNAGNSKITRLGIF